MQKRNITFTKGDYGHYYSDLKDSGVSRYKIYKQIDTGKWQVLLLAASGEYVSWAPSLRVDGFDSGTCTFDTLTHAKAAIRW
jgi:hypothetical protein